MNEKPIHTIQAEEWAKAQDVMGYTFRTHLRAGKNGQFGNAADWPNRYPSVYYKRGHATLDHKEPNNIGWEGGNGWNCLFFNNVNSADWTAAKTARDSRDNVKKVAFATQMNKTYTSLCTNDVWNPKGSVNKGLLVEIWRRPDGEIRVHPSRNPFHWANADPLRQELHSLATNTKIMQASRHAAREMQS